MGFCRAAPWSAEQRRTPRGRTRFGLRKRRRGLVAETGKRSSRPHKGWRERPIPDEEGEATEWQRAKAGYPRCPGLRLGRGWSWLVCSWPEFRLLPPRTAHELCWPG